MSSRPAALVSCLLLGAFGCGADADGVAQGSGALEPRLSSAAERGDTEMPSAAEAEGEAATSNGNGSDVRPSNEAGGTPLVLPQRSPITEPPDPEPFPTTELETTRPVNSTEPVDVIIPPGECRFEYLGKSVHCENAVGSHVIATEATDLFSCMRLCLERDDCTAVTDYLYLGQPEAACELHLASCDDPELAEDDADDVGHDFRRVCDG